MSKTITLKADTFKYPTLEERRIISSLTPRIDRFNVEYKSATIEILGDFSLDSAIKGEDIYWWCNCINNRLGKLEETFVYVQTHYRRKQEIKKEKFEDRHTDKILLEYFIEIFYYYFFSTRDVIGQLLNIFCDLGIEEHKILLNEKFVEKIQSNEIKSALTDFLNNTKDSYNIRNSFNHRYTPTHQDFRAKRNVIKEANKISFYPAQVVRIETFVDDIESLMKHFGYLMNKLILQIK